jgi:hypothetical protein
VWRHHHTVQIGELRDPFQLGDPTDIARVGADDANSVALDQFLEVLSKVDLLTGVNRCRGRARQLAIDVGIDVEAVVAGKNVFEP